MPFDEVTNMDTTRIIALNTLKNVFGRKSSILLLLVAPSLITILMFFVITGIGTRPYQVALVDDSRSAASEAYVDFLQRRTNFQVTVHDGVTETLQEAVVNGRVGTLVHIPADFQARLTSGEAPLISMDTLQESPMGHLLADISNQYLALLSSVPDATRSPHPSGETIETLQSIAIEASVAYNSLGILVFLLLLSSTMVTGIVQKERLHFTYARVLSSPVRAHEYMLGVMTAAGITTVLQIVLCVITLWYLGIPLATVVSLALSLALFALVAIALGLLIVTVSKNQVQSGALTNLIVVPSCMLGGCFWSPNFMPDFLQRLSYLTPQRWLMGFIENALFQTLTSADFWALGVVAAFGFAMFSISAYRIARPSTV